MQNWQATLLSQYANSPILTALIESMNDAIDPATDIDLFYSKLWDIDTATGYGLDVWGRIVGIGRTLDVPVTGKYFSFARTGLTTAIAGNFNNAVFNTRSSLQSTYVLSDDAYRTLILFKAFTNVTNCSIPSLNTAARVLLGGIGTFFYITPGYVDPGYVAAESSSRAWVIDNGGMSLTYKFDFPLTPIEVSIVTKPGLLPSPTGVSVTVIHG